MDGWVGGTFELYHKKEANESVKWYTCCTLSETAKDMYVVEAVRLLRGIVVIDVC